jgi:hypothetical protein
VTSVELIRQLAVRLPDVTSAPHFDREAFKVGGLIFATLGDDTLNLRLTPELQAELVIITSSAEPCAGAWGRQGWSAIRYADIPSEDLDDWLLQAWRHRATAKIRAAHDL